MGNWDFILPYNKEASDWLEEQGLPHPPVLPGNRLPTPEEIKEALEALNISAANCSVLIDYFTSEVDGKARECFQMRGNQVQKLQIIVKLCERCGQFWMCADSGAPAIVIDASLDPIQVAAIYAEVAFYEQGWEQFHARMYVHPAQNDP
jgi:hypothetical protein